MRSVPPLSRITTDRGNAWSRQGAAVSGGCGRLVRMTDSAASEPSAPVTYDLDAGIATITLHRPEAMNSFNLETKLALLDAVHRAAQDEDARCVVLTGSGRSFSAGQDLKEHVANLKAGDTRLSTTVEEHFNPIVTALTTNNHFQRHHRLISMDWCAGFSASTI